MTDEPEVIVVVLRAPRAIADWCALRRALKALLRQLGLKHQDHHLEKPR